MNRFLSVLFFFISSFILAQQYAFDYFILSDYVRIKPNSGSHTHQKMINSKDNTYELYIFENGDASLFDSSTNKSHHFTVKYDEAKNLSFKYIETADFDAKKSSEIFTEVKKISDNVFILYDFYNKRKRRIDTEISVKIKEAPANLIEISADIGTEKRKALEDALKKVLPRDKNYIIEEYTVDYRNGYVMKNSLKRFSNVNVMLEVPATKD